MVALNEKFHYKDTTAPRRGVTGYRDRTQDLGVGSWNGSESLRFRRGQNARCRMRGTECSTRGYGLQRGGESAQSGKSVDVYNLQRSMFTDQKFGTSDDLLIDHRSLLFERSARVYQGGRKYPVTRLYHFDHRDYSITLGGWIDQDPAGYANGANTYQLAVSNPVGNVGQVGPVTVPPMPKLGQIPPNPVGVAVKGGVGPKGSGSAGGLIVVSHPLPPWLGPHYSLFCYVGGSGGYSFPHGHGFHVTGVSWGIGVSL